MLIIGLVIVVIVLSYVLSRSTDILVAGINQLSKGTKFESYGLTIFLVALATSLPELFVGVTAAIEGKASLPLGVVVGSNIANVSLILGGAAVLAGAVRAQGEICKKDILYAFLIACLPLLMLLDKNLSRVDGSVLLLVYVFFVIVAMNRKKKRRLENVEQVYYQEQSVGQRILTVLGKKDVEAGLVKLVIGSALLIISADWVVRISNVIANKLDIPLLIVGLFMVAVGTSLPELTFEIKTITKKEYLMAYGNIIGSTVANSALIMGLVGVLSPTTLSVAGSRSYFLSVIVFVIIYGLFWGFSWSKRSLDRWEGMVLVLVYFGFMAVEMWWLK